MARQIALAIPELQTDAERSRARAWFIVRVPSPHVLETPTPVDTSKLSHSVSAARRIRFGAVPEVIPHPAGLDPGGTQILHATPDPLSDSVIFRTLARSPILKNAPEVAELRPPMASALRRAPVPVEQHPKMAKPFASQDAEPFHLGPATLWTAHLYEAVPREAGPATPGVRPIPDSAEFFNFRNRSLAVPSWDFKIASPTGASFAACAALPYEPATGRAVMPASAHQQWNKPGDKPLPRAAMLQLLQLAPGLAPFSEVAHPDSMRFSFATDLRNRIFDPIRPQFPRICLRPPRVEPTTSLLRASHAFEPLGFRWQRSRRVRDRGASWKAPISLALLPACEPQNWPGPLSDRLWGTRPTLPN
jgi:hypothetical protein